jgi:hypothetical protein
MWVIPDFGIWGIFLQKKGEKSWGAKIRTSFGVEFSPYNPVFIVYFHGLG